jgi:hypothetical protein
VLALLLGEMITICRRDIAFATPPGEKCLFSPRLFRSRAASQFKKATSRVALTQVGKSGRYSDFLTRDDKENSLLFLPSIKLLRHLVAFFFFFTVQILELTFVRFNCMTLQTCILFPFLYIIHSVVLC